MNDDSPIDFSSLDPERETGRWRSVVERTSERVAAVLAERARWEDPLAIIAEWRRPLLLAAAAVIALLVPAELALERREVEMERVRRLVAISHLPASDPLLGGVEFRRALVGPTP